MTSDSLTPAKLSYCIALIPTNPIKDMIASASLAITKRFENINIIDNKKFPAHISLHIGGTDREFLDSLKSKLQLATESFMRKTYVADRLYLGSRGFVGVNCVADDLIPFIDAVVDASSELHQEHPRFRPHHLERWPKLTSEQQDSIKKFGTYKIGGAAKPHLSVAQVDEEDAGDAFRIAQKHIQLPQDFLVESIQIVDVGHKNEKWDVLYQW